MASDRQFENPKLGAPFAYPILSSEDAKGLEKSILGSDADVWAAMQHAGRSVADAIIADYAELGEIPERLRVLALVGKGHNGGDALIACGRLLARYPRASVHLVMTAGTEELRPLTARAFVDLEGRVGLHFLRDESVDPLLAHFDSMSDGEGFHLCIDGILGMSFRPPLSASVLKLIDAVNAYQKISFRAALDLPTGVQADADRCFQADFSYATGIAKTPLFEGHAACGRIRFLDLGFFEKPEASDFGSEEMMLSPKVLSSMGRFRKVDVDKRSFGHLFIVGGSRMMPGAVLMAVRAAIRSGVGLVTAFVPESVAPAFAAQVPEAMWVSWPEADDGTLDRCGAHVLLDQISRADALLVGPGMGRGESVEELVGEIAGRATCPVLIDADGLRSYVLESLKRRTGSFGRVVLSPHFGEYLRIAGPDWVEAGNSGLLDFCLSHHVTTVLKGPQTRVCDGAQILYSTVGGPVLARGGSGDLLAGLIAGMMAQTAGNVTLSVARGVMAHGLAASLLTRACGETFVNTTQLLDHLPMVLGRKAESET